MWILLEVIGFRYDVVGQTNKNVNYELKKLNFYTH